MRPRNRHRVLLVHPPQTLAAAGRDLPYVPPLGLLYLRQVLAGDGIDAAVLDMDADGRDGADLLRLVGAGGYDAVGISVFTRTRQISYGLVRSLRGRFPGLYLMLGGPHATLAPGDALAGGGADAIVRGEAERVIVRVVRDRPRGVVQADPPSDLDALPWPERAPPLIDRRQYGHLLQVRFARRCGVVASSRGCPRRCAFCMRVGLVPHRVRRPERFVDELAMLVDQGYEGLIFNDDNFLSSPRRALRIAELMVRRRLRVDFAIQGWATPSEELWQGLAEAGLAVACVGVEHIHPGILSYLNKTADPHGWPERVARTAELMNRHHVISCGSFILGAPMETAADAERLIRFLCDAGFDLKNSNELLFAYGTALWRDAVDRGWFGADRFHVPATEVFADKRGYVGRMLDLAWRQSVRALPRIAWKLLRSGKRDKLAPLLSLAAALWRGGRRLLRDRPDQGYGLRGEVAVDRCGDRRWTAETPWELESSQTSGDYSDSSTTRLAT